LHNYEVVDTIESSARVMKYQEPPRALAIRMKF
jgi:hypothetical protein